MHQYYTNDSLATTNSHMEQHHLSSFLGQDHSTSSSFLTSTYNDISQSDQFHEESESEPQRQQQQMSNDMDLSKQHDFGSHDFLTAPSVELLSEPPPYDQFTVDWPGDLPSIPFQTPTDFSQPPKIFQPEEEELFGQFLGTIEKDNFLFNPELPPNLLMMPQYIPPTNDSTYGESVTFSSGPMLDNVYGLSSDSENIHHQIAASASNSTSLSPRTQNLVLSSSPKADNAKLPSPNSDNNSNSKNSSNSNNRKRGRIDDDDPKNTRRSSNPRLTPVNTKVASTSSRNVTSTSSRPGSPTLELSNLSINIDSTSSSSSGGDGDGDGNSRNNNSGTASPTPQSPNRESTKTESVLMDNEDDEDDDDDESSSNINTNEGSVDIKSESKTTEGSSKSSRKPYKELLTEEEKRANHIASEQKRRNTIRAGFKELTDIIPTLKNVNNSKSTILFKAVDYIKYLERRNRSLKERASFLEMRVEMEMRPGKRFHHHPAAYGPALGFGHARVSSMQMSPAYSVIPNGINGVGLQMTLGHPTPQHVMNGPPPQMQNMYYNPNAADTQSIMTNVSPINSTTNNLYRQNGVMTIPQPHPLNDNFKLTSAMSIPTNLEDQDLQRPLIVSPGSTLDVDGDSSMVMSGNVRSSGGSVVVKG